LAGGCRKPQCPELGIHIIHSLILWFFWYRVCSLDHSASSKARLAVTTVLRIAGAAFQLHALTASSDSNHIQSPSIPDLLNANRGPREFDPPVEALPYLWAAIGFLFNRSFLFSGL
jgi:hypothetical protein